MAEKTRLRDFQNYLAARFASAAGEGAAASWLGFSLGQEAWLLALAEGGEIVQSPVIEPVPLAPAWLAGLANVRGTLFAVTDFQAFCTGQACELSSGTRLLTLGGRSAHNAALLVPALLGMKRPADYTEIARPAAAPAWLEAVYRDAQGQSWRKLNVKALLADPRFKSLGA